MRILLIQTEWLYTHTERNSWNIKTKGEREGWCKRIDIEITKGVRERERKKSHYRLWSQRDRRSCTYIHIEKKYISGRPVALSLSLSLCSSRDTLYTEGKHADYKTIYTNSLYPICARLYWLLMLRLFPWVQCQKSRAEELHTIYTHVHPPRQCHSTNPGVHTVNMVVS